MCGFSEAWKLSREGMIACNKGDFFTAENNLQQAIAMSGCKSKRIHKATMYNNLAVVFQMGGKIDNAIDAYRMSLSFLNPDHKGQANLIRRIQGNMNKLITQKAA